MAEHVSFDFNKMTAMIDAATTKVQAQLDKMKEKSNTEGETVGIGDMFDTQMMMNQLSQLSEMSTGVMSASNTALASMARNVKA